MRVYNEDTRAKDLLFKKKIGRYHVDRYEAIELLLEKNGYEGKSLFKIAKSMDKHCRLQMDWYKTLSSVKRRLNTTDVKLYLYLSMRFSNKRDKGYYISEKALIKRFSMGYRHKLNIIRLNKAFKAITESKLLIHHYTYKDGMYYWTWQNVKQKHVHKVQKHVHKVQKHVHKVQKHVHKV